MKKNILNMLTKFCIITCISVNVLYVIFSAIMWLLVAINLIFVPNFYSTICFVLIILNIAFAFEIGIYLIFRKR